MNASSVTPIGMVDAASITPTGIELPLHGADSDDAELLADLAAELCGPDAEADVKVGESNDSALAGGVGSSSVQLPLDHNVNPPSASGSTSYRPLRGDQMYFSRVRRHWLQSEKDWVLQECIAQYPASCPGPGAFKALRLKGITLGKLTDEVLATSMRSLYRTYMKNK